ncbi:MAG: nucleotidyltransferase domain-containing protein [Gammaproteobacteria bacterium]
MALDNYKAEYRELQKELASEFIQSPHKVLKLLLKRSKSIDGLLKRIWADQSFDRKITLVAVGGYGREELHLHSDIDIMILIPNQSYSKYEEKISNFLTILWDVGIEIGHSTRDLSDCIVAMSDLSIATNILESRFICGSKVLFEKMYQSLQISGWSDQSFFIAKKKEQ